MIPHRFHLNRRPSVGPSGHALAVATLMRPRGETGVQAHVNAFLDYLAAQGLRPPCITPFSSSKFATYPVFAVGPLLGLLRRREARVWWYRHWHYVFLKRALRCLVSDGRPRVIYAQDPLAARAAFETRTSQRQRVVMVVHFNVSQAEEWAEKGMLRKGGQYYESIRHLERTILPRLDGIVFVSAFMQEMLARDMPSLARVPSLVLPNFVSAPPLQPRQPVRDLMSIGTLEPRKNHEYLIRMLAAAKDLGRHPSLTIVGDGPERSRLETLSKELGVAEQIHFAGFRANAADMIPDHRVYCHASRLENSPITLIEAMARGVPVVAAPVGGVPEVFEAGAEGLQWDLSDPLGGAQQVLRLLDDRGLYEEIREAALRRYQVCFRTDVVAHRLHEFLLSLIQQPSTECVGGGAFS